MGRLHSNDKRGLQTCRQTGSGTKNVQQQAYSKIWHQKHEEHTFISLVDSMFTRLVEILRECLRDGVWVGGGSGDWIWREIPGASCSWMENGSCWKFPPKKKNPGEVRVWVNAPRGLRRRDWEQEQDWGRNQDTELPVGYLYSWIRMNGNSRFSNTNDTQWQDSPAF